MTKLLNSVAVAVALLLPSMALAADWKIDANHSTASFAVKHMMITTVHGQFTGITGDIQFDESAPTKAKIDVTIDVASVDTRNEKRDAHLKSPDFFDATKHPTFRFKSKKIVKAGKQYKMTGDLTMRGVTKEVILLTDVSQAMKSPWGQTVIGIHATTTIDRQQFGISWNKSLDRGGLLVDNEVKITIDLELQKDQGKSAAR